MQTPPRPLPILVLVILTLAGLNGLPDKPVTRTASVQVTQ